MIDEIRLESILDNKLDQRCSPVYSESNRLV